jgi:hypothetical protein
VPVSGRLALLFDRAAQAFGLPVLLAFGPQARVYRLEPHNTPCRPLLILLVGKQLVAE